jgi:hypothetical protein
LEQILSWADAHKGRTGDWPARHSGDVAAGDLTWKAIDAALHQGHRGLPGGDSLARLLRRERGRVMRRIQRQPSEAALVRRRRAAQLRQKGLTLGQIGRCLGVSRQAVLKMLRRAVEG